jgi:hypothetical protein
MIPQSDRCDQLRITSGSTYSHTPYEPTMNKHHLTRSPETSRTSKPTGSIAHALQKPGMTYLQICRGIRRRCFNCKRPPTHALFCVCSPTYFHLVSKVSSTSLPCLLSTVASEFLVQTECNRLIFICCATKSSEDSSMFPILRLSDGCRTAAGCSSSYRD